MCLSEVIRNIPIITALVAVILGPMVSFFIVKVQLKSSINSTNRQEWINTLRNEITDYLFTFVEIEGMWFDKADKAEFTDPLNRLRKHKIKISLLLNPNEKEHQVFIKSIDEAYLTLKNPSPKALKFAEEKIVKLSQNILKKEWERVKSMS